MPGVNISSDLGYRLSCKFRCKYTPLTEGIIYPIIPDLYQYFIMGLTVRAQISIIYGLSPLIYKDIIKMNIGLFFFVLTPILAYRNAIFYCGFSGHFCGQSIADDVNENIQTVILAFANTIQDGSIMVDENNFPAEPVTKWKRNGKTVLLSVGGQNGNWKVVFRSETATNNFIESLVNAVQKFRLDGVDIDIQGYLATPRTVANMIIKLKQSLNTLGHKILVVSPEDVTIYQGVQVPGPDAGGQPWNYFVPIVQLADDYIDFYQPQAYNNWYDGLPGGSLDYYKDVYLNWRNFQGLSQSAGPIPGFSGVKGSKLRIGLLASSSAGIPDYYGEPQTIKEFQQFLKRQNYDLYGFMIWDSHWDELNQFAISNACEA